MENFLRECANIHWENKWALLWSLSFAHFIHTLSQITIYQVSLKIFLKSWYSYRYHESQHHKDKAEPDLHLWKSRVIHFPLGRIWKQTNSERLKNWHHFFEMEKPTLPGALTYHKLNTDVIRDIFQAFEADLNPILGVVQIAQMQHDDLVAFLEVENESARLSIYPAGLSFLQYSTISNCRHLWIHVWLLGQMSNKY